MSDNKKRNKTKSYYQQMNKRKKLQTLEAGLKGFFCTCNFQEKNCVREAYNLLNEYADKLYGPEHHIPPEKEENEEEVDICDELEKQVSDMKTEDKRFKRFTSVQTTVANCIFIKADVENTVELGYSIIKDIAETKCQKTRYLLRIVPIEATCSAKIDDIVSTAGKLFDKYFLGEPTTFSIVFNRRYNNSLPRDLVIKELAQIITTKNCNHKADLTKAKQAVIVEVIKGTCLLSVVPDYFLNKKYNLYELCNPQKPDESMQKEKSNTVDASNVVDDENKEELNKLDEDKETACDPE